MSGKLRGIGIEKHYKEFSLKPMTLELKKGCLTGLVGVNGAGKSTLIRILGGIDQNYIGQVLVDGVSMRKDYEKAKQKIALVSEEISYFADKTPLENGELLGGYFKNWRMEELYQWLDRLNLPKGQPIYQFSKGMYMKYQIAFAMAYHPQYLLLDEPTAGFDPVFRKDFIKIIQEVRKEELGILMSTHILSDIEGIADDVIIISNGELKIHETKESMKRRSIQDQLESFLTNQVSIKDLLRKRRQ